jgi:serine/threonine protein kinase
MLVIEKMDIDLKNYLHQNHNKLTWKERVRIINNIISSLYYVHEENEIHRDLHSGNILYSKYNDYWFISDLGFCGPADKSSESIYGNLPYVAPEVIVGKGYTFKSVIYSIAILMWEISSGQLPFINYEHDYRLATNIINGIRPKIVPETPLEYKNLMEQCWDVDPSKRPDIQVLWKKMEEIKLLYQNTTTNKDKNIIKKIFKKFKSTKSNKNDINSKLNETSTSSQINHTSSRLYKLYTSKVHQFENLPEPRNATEGNNKLIIILFYNVLLLLIYKIIFFL